MYSLDPLPYVVYLCPAIQFGIFSSHIRFPQSGPQTAVNLTQWRPPVLAYKIDMEKEQTKLNTLFSVSTSSGVAVAVL